MELGNYDVLWFCFQSTHSKYSLASWCDIYLDPSAKEAEAGECGTSLSCIVKFKPGWNTQ